MRRGSEDRIIVLDFGGGRYMFKYFSDNKLMFFSKVFQRKAEFEAGFKSFIYLLDAPVEYSKNAQNPKHLMFRQKEHYYFTLTNAKGTTIGRSEAFKTEEDCIQAIYHLYDYARKAEIKYLEEEAV